jgi:alkylation response protein AidB-like acyl-CoA dehydrogenase/acyl-CoA synthetase (AMP-forming)/AMP-acid ligase II
LQPILAPIRPTSIARRLPRTGLLDWLERPTTDRGLHFAGDDGSWSYWDYPRLARLVAEAAAKIEAERTRDSGPVSIALPAGPQFVATFLGALVAGHTPSPLALPVFLRDPDGYVRHVAKILEAADPALVVSDHSLNEPLTHAIAQAGLAGAPAEFELTGDHDVELRRHAPAEYGLLQFTSGSSGRPRGVQVTFDNLETNIAQMQRWLGMSPDSAWGSWLPLYHDMGLIGTLLAPMTLQSDVWLMRPDQFIRKPLRWLELFGRHGVEICMAPNFGYAYSNQRVTDAQLEGLDFSSWRAAIIAAERVDPQVMTTFAKRLEPFGFRRSTFAPGYGLAEATLAVSGNPLDTPTKAVKPRWSEMGFGERVTIEAEAEIGDEDAFGNGSGWLVASGRPLEELRVTIVDEDGNELPEGHLGEVKVVGPSVAHGYTIDTGGSTRFEGDALTTGDAALMLDGELFVLGRIGDSMKIRGRTVFVEDVEAQVNATEGIASRKVVVLAGADGSRNTLAAIVEAKRGAWVEEVARILEAEAGGDAQVKVLASPPRTIQRTSSGKPRRRLMWKDLLNGSMPGEVVFTNGSSEGEVPVLSRGIADPGVELFRDRVRALIDRYVSPLVDEAEEQRAFPREAIAELGREGLFRERWAGGDHGDCGKSALICEELARRGTGGVGVGVSVQMEAVLATLLRHGKTEELQALTEAALDGRMIGCVATSERANGSDVASIETTAMREGNGWRITGEKRYVSLGAAADFALVLAREHDPRTASIAPSLTLFAVPASGFTVTDRLQGVGMRSLETVTLQIDAYVPHGNLISRSGRGVHAIQWGLLHERLATAAVMVGTASLALELATTHAERRVQFGAKLIRHQAVRVHLGEMASELWVARAGLYALAGSLDKARSDTARSVAAAKVTAAIMAERIVSDCLQVLGGRGYLEDMTPLARLWRDVRLGRIGGGTDEMMWELVAGGLQGDDELYDRFVRTDW